MKCSVIGLGYIGLPTAALLAKKGHKVVGECTPIYMYWKKRQDYN